MSPTQLYQHLKDLAVKFDIAVLEQNLRVTGVNAKSGLCKVKAVSYTHLTLPTTPYV